MTQKGQLLEKFKEAAASVLPIVIIVGVMCLTFVPMQADLMLSFLIGSLMLIVGMVVSMIIPDMNTVLRTAIKILTIPAVVGVGYELIKLAGRKDNAFTRLISIPGMWVQHITTREPDDDMIACAIAALKPVIPENPEDDQW